MPDYAAQIQPSDRWAVAASRPVGAPREFRSVRDL